MRNLPLACLLILLAACVPPKREPAQMPAPAKAAPIATEKAAAVPPLRRLGPGELPRFKDTLTARKSRADLVTAGRRTIKYLAGKPAKVFTLGDRKYTPEMLAATAREFIALWQKNLPPEEFAEEVSRRFDVYKSAGLDGKGRVVFSSYYQPIIQASLKKTRQYPYPIYAKPKDMVVLDLKDFDKKLPAKTLVGRITKSRKGRKLRPYHDRERIDSRGALKGRGLELAYLPTRFDVLDLHIQGSGILRFPSGKEMLAGFAATNGLPYHSVGLTLVAAGVFTREEITHDKIRQYFLDHPESQLWVMARNPRYTFFKLSKLPPDGEPYGTAEQRLSPGRAIAIDPAVIPLGALAYFSTVSPQADRKGRLLGKFPNSRFAFCLDTGGAIKSPGRVDIYAGHGPMAATVAKNQWDDGELYILVSKAPPKER